MSEAPLTTADLDALTASMEAWTVVGCTTAQIPLAEAHALIAAARKAIALEKYAEHRYRCSKFEIDSEGPCTCGLDALKGGE